MANRKNKPGDVGWIVSPPTWASVVTGFYVTPELRVVVSSFVQFGTMITHVSVEDDHMTSPHPLWTFAKP